ncbi:hypothetical protein BDAP_000803 [Binucleata daphniae]
MFKLIAFLSGLYRVDDESDFEQQTKACKPVQTIENKYKGKARSYKLAAIISKKRKVTELEEELLNLSIKSKEEKIECLINSFDAWKHLGKRRKCKLQ